MRTARKWWLRYEEDGNLNELPRPGRPRVLTADQEADIIRRIEENPFLTAVSFAREYHVDVSVISSLFRQHGLRCQTAAFETRLTEDHRIYRVAFCEKILEEWDDNRLESIIFSDEKTFCTDVSWRSKVYRPYNTRYEPHYVKEIGRSGRITNNYWGAIGRDGPVTPLVRIQGRFNAPAYMRIVRAYVIPMMNRFEADGDPHIFMQDNSRVHTDQRVMALFSRQHFQPMDWPANSPDLNPIENVWSMMENGWPEIHPRTAENLHDVVQDRWYTVGANQRESLHLKYLKVFFISMDFSSLY